MSTNDYASIYVIYLSLAALTLPTSAEATVITVEGNVVFIPFTQSVYTYNKAVSASRSTE